MFPKYVSFVAGLTLICSVAATAELAELNAHLDDDGEVYLNGELVTFPKRQAPGDEEKDTTSVDVNLVEGTNSLAIYVLNHAWGGQLMASMVTPANDTVVTNSSWKSGLRNPDGWKTKGYDDSNWANAVDIGAIDSAPGFENSGLAWANMYYQGARRIWGPSKIYFRKEFEASGQDVMVFIRGNNFDHKVYVNGALVGEGDEFADCGYPDTRCLSLSAQKYSVTLESGTNCVAVEASDYWEDGNGALMKLGLMVSNTEAVVVSDETWKCSAQKEDGWNTIGFDDAEWVPSGTPSAYDQTIDALTNAGATWMWPQEFYFRHTFEWDGNVVVPVLGTIRSKAPTASVVRTELYNLKGEKVSTAVKRVGANSVLIKRSVLSDGTVRAKRIRSK